MSDSTPANAAFTPEAPTEGQAPEEAPKEAPKPAPKPGPHNRRQPEPASTDDGDEAEENLRDDPEAMWELIQRLRKENGRSRVEAKTRAAEEARAEMMDVVTKALGLKNGEDEEAPSLETLQAEAAKAEAERLASRRELAVYKAAGSFGADPDALLDSRAFIESISDLDPSDAEGIEAAVKKAAESSPRFRAAQAAGPTRTDHAPGGPSPSTPKTLAEALSAHYAGQGLN